MIPALKNPGCAPGKVLLEWSHVRVLSLESKFKTLYTIDLVSLWESKGQSESLSFSLSDGEFTAEYSTATEEYD